MSLHTDCLPQVAKIDTEICNTCPHIQTDSGKLIFVLRYTGQVSGEYLPVPRLYKEHAQKLE